MSDSLFPRDDRASEREETLRQIDSFLRTAAVPDKLARFITAEPASNAGDAAAHHPDAEELLRRAHERRPTATQFKAATLRAALHRLLYDRWTTAVQRRLSEQPRAVIDRVVEQLARLAPGHCLDDLWLVWCRLAKKFPENETFSYTDRQIRGFCERRSR